MTNSWVLMSAFNSHLNRWICFFCFRPLIIQKLLRTSTDKTNLETDISQYIIVLGMEHLGLLRSECFGLGCSGFLLFYTSISKQSFCSEALWSEQSQVFHPQSKEILTDISFEVHFVCTRQSKVSELWVGENRISKFICPKDWWMHSLELMNRFFLFSPLWFRNFWWASAGEPITQTILSD